MDVSDIAARLNRPGAVGVIPTDTVYGLVARAADQAAVQRLYDLKKRESKPGTVIAASLDQLAGLGIKSRYVKAVAQYWPGPVSVIVPVADPALGYLHQGKQSLAVRLPDAEQLRKLLETTGPLLTTSANQPGQPTAETIEAAKAAFGVAVDFYADGGDMSGRQASTIIRIVDDAVEIIRQGAVKIEENQ